MGKLQEKYKEVIEMIDKGDFQNAYKLTEEMRMIPQQPLTDFLVGSIFNDLGKPMRRPDLIEQGIQLLEKRGDELMKYEEECLLPQYHYNLGNGYGSLAQYWINASFSENSTNADLLHYKKWLDQARTHYENVLDLNHAFRAQVYINLAINLNYLGRSIEALDCYDQALRLVPNHPMALANRGVSLYNLAFFTWHPNTYILEAYHNLIRAFPGVTSESKQYFLHYLCMIEQCFTEKELLNNPPHYPGIKLQDTGDLESHLTKLCLHNRLYLNFCSFCQQCEAAIGDTVIIKTLTVSNKDLKSEDVLTIRNPYVRFSTFLEEIKKEFVTSRFLIALSKDDRADYSFVFKHFHSAETFDGRLTDIRIQFLKTAFKGMYDVLDKIAGFINQFWKVGMKDDDVSFARIWYEDKEKLNHFFLTSKNKGLLALFSLYTDLRDRHRFKFLKKIRHALTHRFMRVGQVNEEETAENMSSESLWEQTLELAKLVRSAILYLLIAVDFEEQIKKPFTGRVERIQVPRKDI